MRQRILFCSLIAIAIGIRLWFVVMLPVGQTVSHRLEGLNDEPAHLKYVDFLASQKHFPIQHHSAREADSFFRNEFEYYQAPLYYVAGAALSVVVGKESRILACRLLSFVFGVLTIAIVYKICTALSVVGAARQAATCFTALLPTHAYFSSVVSNDSLCWLFSALCILVLVKQFSAASKPWQPIPMSVVLGILLGIGMLVKASIVVFAPAVVLFFWIRYHETRNRTWLPAFAILAGISFCIAGFWYIRNVHLYGSLFAEEIGNGSHQFFLLQPKLFFVFLNTGLYSFWFPMQHVHPSHFTGAIYHLETLYTLAGIILFLYYYIQGKKIHRAEIILGTVLLSTVIAYLKYNLYWTNSDGRFLLPALAGISVFFCVPLAAIFKKYAMEYAAPIAASICALFPYSLLLLVK